MSRYGAVVIRISVVSLVIGGRTPGISILFDCFGSFRNKIIFFVPEYIIFSIYIALISLYSNIVYSRDRTECERSYPLGKPNFSFQKRQKELAKIKKNEEKRQRKLDKDTIKPAGDQEKPIESGEDNKNGG